jgi:hypothetical protein
MINDSDESEDEIPSDETRYDTGGLDSNSTLTTSSTGDDHDHILFHVSPF